MHSIIVKFRLVVNTICWVHWFTGIIFLQWWATTWSQMNHGHISNVLKDLCGIWRTLCLKIMNMTVLYYLLTFYLTITKMILCSIFYIVKNTVYSATGWLFVCLFVLASEPFKNPKWLDNINNTISRMPWLAVGLNMSSIFKLFNIIKFTNTLIYIKF